VLKHAANYLPHTLFNDPGGMQTSPATHILFSTWGAWGLGHCKAAPVAQNPVRMTKLCMASGRSMKVWERSEGQVLERGQTVQSAIWILDLRIDALQATRT
jgi:hypothetical protein